MSSEKIKFLQNHFDSSLSAYQCYANLYCYWMFHALHILLLLFFFLFHLMCNKIKVEVENSSLFLSFLAIKLQNKSCRAVSFMVFSIFIQMKRLLSCKLEHNNFTNLNFMERTTISKSYSIERRRWKGKRWGSITDWWTDI